METYSIKRFFGIILVMLFAVSCSSELDFDQVNDFKMQPAYIGNLSSFDIPAKDFVKNGVEQNMVFDAEDFDVFRDKFFRDNLKRADLSFEFTNTVNRAFNIEIVLFDLNDQPVYVIPFNVPAYSGSPNTIKHTEIFENSKLDLLKSSRRIGFVINLAPGPALNVNSSGSLKLRSSATVYLVVE